MTRRKILLYNRPWGQENEEDYTVPITDEFELTVNRENLDEAVAIIFHMPTLERDDELLKNGRKKGQTWIYWSRECEAHYTWHCAPEITNLFDLTVSYRLNSDVPYPYFETGYKALLTVPPKPKHQFTNAFISSNFNHSKRIEYLQELMSYIKIDSYGKLFKNADLPDDEGEKTKNDFISTYKFTLAFENAIAPDYVTEKFFQPLIAGSVPIYLGAPNIEDFAPADHSYINANSFSSVSALADYIKHLDQNENEYQKYLNWKERPLRASFLSMLNSVEIHPLVRLCEKIKPLL